MNVIKMDIKYFWYTIDNSPNLEIPLPTPTTPPIIYVWVPLTFNVANNCDFVSILFLQSFQASNLILCMFAFA